MLSSNSSCGALTRKIIHVDMDAFFASVEQRDNPDLRGKPVVVGGSPESRGVVCAASYEARAFGVRSAMSCAKAYRLCPDAIFVSPNFSRYSEVSRQLRDIFLSVTDLVEPLSLDEAFLDVTENKLGEPLARNIAMWIKEEILGQTGLTASAGVGPNKLIAKLASDFKKPDGLVVIPPEKVLRFLAPLPVESIWGVGSVTKRKLNDHGFYTVQDLRRSTPTDLESFLGKYGPFLHSLAFGIDERPVLSEREPKSHGSETTFSYDISDPARLETTLLQHCQELSSMLQAHKREARTITVKMKFPSFRSITRSRTLARPTSDYDEISKTALELFRERDTAEEPALRLLGLTVSGFGEMATPQQLLLPFPAWNPNASLPRGGKR